jgi:hypothetical protein
VYQIIRCPNTDRIMNSYYSENLKKNCRWKCHVGKTDLQKVQYLFCTNIVFNTIFFSTSSVHFVSYFVTKINPGNEIWKTQNMLNLIILSLQIVKCLTGTADRSLPLTSLHCSDEWPKSMSGFSYEIDRWLPFRCVSKPIKTMSLSDATNLIGFSETEIYWEDDGMFRPTKPSSGRSKAPENKW